MTKKYNHKFDDIPVVDTRTNRDDSRLAEPVEVLQVTLTYNKGGEGWRPEPRGWTLRVQPTAYVRPEPGVVIQRYNPREGVRRFVHEVQRASKKGQREAIAKAEAVKAELVQFCLDHNPHLRVVTEQDEEVA
jgi:hypothetical protein